MMLYIAGLQQIDPNLYEAAHIDGATAGRCFWRVTVPLLGPTIRLSVFFAVLGLVPAVRPDHAAHQGRARRTARRPW